MKITIEKKGEKDQVFEDVIEYALIGHQGKGQINDFFNYNGRVDAIIGKLEMFKTRLMNSIFNKE